jgi:hypothetical protein
MALRFGRPDVQVLTLETGDTLTVRRRLNAGEARGRVTRMSERTDAGLQYNQLLRARATITAYLLDWTVTDAATGTRVDIGGLALAELETILDNLDPDDFRAVYDAIDAHERAMAAERDAEKKTQGIGPGSSPT